MIDTTAHSIAAALGLLALNNDVQEEIYQHIISVIGYDNDPVCASDIDSIVMMFDSHPSFQVFDDYAKLNKVLAAFYEAVRMFRKLDVLKISRSLIIYFSMGIYSSWTPLDS